MADQERQERYRQHTGEQKAAKEHLFSLPEDHRQRSETIDLRLIWTKQ